MGRNSMGWDGMGWDGWSRVHRFAHILATFSTFLQARHGCRGATTLQRGSSTFGYSVPFTHSKCGHAVLDGKYRAVPYSEHLLLGASFRRPCYKAAASAPPLPRLSVTRVHIHAYRTVYPDGMWALPLNSVRAASVASARRRDRTL